MKRSWIKLYLEILDDPKMGRLPDHLWRRCTELFLVAGEYDCDGLLPPPTDIIWRLRITEEQLLEALHALETLGIVQSTAEGWVVAHFKDRQFSESYERVKRFRERFRERYSNGESNEGGNAVVAGKESPSSSTSSSPSDSLEEGGGVGEGETIEITTGSVATLYEQEIGALTPLIADAIQDACDTYPIEWIPEAIQIAAASNKRSWSYVEGVLKNCKTKNISPSLSRLEKPNGNNGTGNRPGAKQSRPKQADHPVYTDADRAAAERVKQRQQAGLPGV